MNTISQKKARDLLSNPKHFEGGVFITKNGISELFIQPMAERERELAERGVERQAIALLKIAMLSKKDTIEGRKMTLEEALRRRKERRV
ncbi:MULTISPECIES: hypothetical protein [Photorhabdus]|uniref:Photorhabdus luminescens subsp. laumondii TTO1 complete genome segment 3/17 n=3 Tax=Photorhabdus TaxID=29487 RepID=Q7N8U3_PHOLL|nr:MULTISPECIES: hypothetical protein [Photorhabdus]AWK40575.1 hypothetical protein A4R40_03080 [Photorhabdus laumondii subsp. laumondii]AXG41383.1 hypothetical protein PluDJC_03115 [Photorhabdus laumondii subsp. laumondii]AXG45914.1 hypothetical protein PluTT01m_03175 [Photorhabdus laumondii subsp. laumondii]KTL63339.1 hypothetical protein AA106_03915 [Photorhabdus laumondii subsp. laumondii]MCC8376187.1 hypothetical protein [Photorhabdus bodei]